MEETAHGLSFSWLCPCHATVGTKKELNVWEPILNIDKEELCAYCILS